MPGLLSKLILRLPPWLLSIFDTAVTRNLYVKLHQLRTTKTEKVVNNKRATFYCPNRESWEAANIKLEQERLILSKIMSRAGEENYNTFFDIGGNIGAFSCFVGQIVNRTVVFEPYEPNISLLEGNLELNDIDSIVESVAVGERNGCTKLNIPISDGSGTEKATILKAHPLEHEFVDHVDVKLVSLDDYIVDENLPRPDLIKIDVEGAGLRVLRGLSQFLAESSPHIFIETHRNSEEIEIFLKKHEYNLNYIFADRDDEAPTIEARQ